METALVTELAAVHLELQILTRADGSYEQIELAY
jgi:hypothetical protein